MKVVVTIFLKINPRCFGPCGKFQDTTQRFLCRPPVFLDYFSVFYDYGKTELIRIFEQTIKRSKSIIETLGKAKDMFKV